MVALTCVMRSMGTALPPQPPYLLGGRSFQELFKQESGQDIDLVFDTSNLGRPLGPLAQAVSTYELHEGLETATGNSWRASSIDRIGVIYAGKFQGAPPSVRVLGLMFDRGFSAGDDQSTAFMQVPREGCAVFVDAIAEIREDPVACRTEILYTTIHELGHVFNLEHDFSGKSFMASSRLAAVPATRAHRFNDTHRGYLSLCSKERCIRPGGTIYGDRGDIGASFDPGETGNGIPIKPGLPLRLEVSLSRDSFWFCEPVELKVVLSRGPDGRGAARVPHRVDPGYDEFHIWIEEPNGHRRRYKPIKFFCALPSNLIVAEGRPFMRDISIFGQSGGYAFRCPGLHRIWATFDTPRGRLVSPVVECELREPSGRFKDFRKLEPLLRRGGKVLYYRSGFRRDDEVAAVEEIIRTFPRTASSAASLHALGLLFSRQATTRTGMGRKELVEKAAGFLQRAVDHGKQDPYCAEKSERILRALRDEAPWT